MTVQNVSCFSEVKFIESDTCTRSEINLKRYTSLAVEFQKIGKDVYSDYGVSWFTLAASGVSAGTACHAGFHSRTISNQVMNVIRWDVSPCVFSKSFQNRFAEWMLDPVESLWKDVMHRVAILRNDAGKPLATLWLNPKEIPSVSLVHFCIAGPRYLTEKSKELISGEKIYDQTGDFNKTYVGAHLTYKGGLIGVQSGHLGQSQSMRSGVPKRFIEQPPVFPKTGMYSIYINDAFIGGAKPWVKRPTSAEDYSECWDMVVKGEAK